MIDRRSASPQGKGAAPPEGGNGRGGGSPGFLGDDSEEDDSEGDSEENEGGEGDEGRCECGSAACPSSGRCSNFLRYDYTRTSGGGGGSPDDTEEVDSEGDDLRLALPLGG